MVFFNHATRQMTAKIVYYGPGLCGKTTNLNIIYARTAQKARGEMVSLNTETDRTLFFDLLPLEVGMVGGFKAKLQLYTVPGQVFYNSTRKLVLKGVDGIVFVVDSQVPMLDANRESLVNLRNNLKELGLHLDEIPTVFQWNKRDLKNVVPVEVLEAELNPRHCPSFQSVAQGGEGVFETLRGITRLALAQIKALHLGETPARAQPLPGLALEADTEPAALAEPVPLAEAVPEAALTSRLDDLFGSAPDFSDAPPASSSLDDLFGSAPDFSDAPPASSSLDDLFGPAPDFSEASPASPSLDDFFGSAPDFSDASAPNPGPEAWDGAPVSWAAGPATPAPEPASLNASELVMPDTLGGEPVTSGGDALSFLDLPTATDLFGDPTARKAVGPRAVAAPAQDPGVAVARVAAEPLAAAEPPASHDPASATPLFLGDLEVPGFRFDDFLTEAAPGSPSVIPAETEAKPAEGMGQVMAPLTVKLRPPMARASGGPPALVKPMAVLRPSAPLVAPRTQVAPVKALPPVPNLPNASRQAHLLRVNLPEHLSGDELEVVVLVRQNGMTIAEGHAQRSAPSQGGSATLNLELKRP